MSTTHQQRGKRHRYAYLDSRRRATAGPDHPSSPPDVMPASLSADTLESGSRRPARSAAARGVAGEISALAHPSNRADSSGVGEIPFGRASFVRGFVFAWNGVVYALRTQRNARVHASIAVAAVTLGILLRISPIEFALVFVAIASVFIAEMINTVVEACVDLVTTEYHPLARVAKDVAAGAVLLNAVLSIVIGLFVFLPHLWPLLLRWLGH